MDDQLRAKFLHVSDLLSQVAEGIGTGGAALVDKSATPIGTALAVKAAHVTVDFALTSEAYSAGLGRSGVGANTLFGATVSKDNESAHATIVLEIVPIGRVEESKPGNAPPAPDRGTAGLSEAVAVLRAVVQQIFAQDRVRLGDAIAKLTAIENALKAGDLNDARTRLQELVTSLPPVRR